MAAIKVEGLGGGGHGKRAGVTSLASRMHAAAMACPAGPTIAIALASD